MEIIKKGKIAILVGNNINEILNYTRKHIKDNYPDVYTTFFHGHGYCDTMDLRMTVDEENTEILVVAFDEYDENVFEYLSELEDIAVIIIANSSLKNIDKNKFIEYPMETHEQREMAYYGDNKLRRTTP